MILRFRTWAALVAACAAAGCGSMARVARGAPALPIPAPRDSACDVLRVPPLREHLSDVPALVEHLVTSLSARLGVRPKRLDPAVLECLMAYDWKRNNIRELRNVVERLIIATDGDAVGLEDVPTEVREAAGPRGASGGPAATSFQALKTEAERQIIVAALERNDWHITRTAQALGLADHASLLKIMRRHNISR